MMKQNNKEPPHHHVGLESKGEKVTTLEKLQLQQLKLKEAQVKLKMNLLLNRDKKMINKSKKGKCVSNVTVAAQNDDVDRIVDVADKHYSTTGRPRLFDSCQDYRRWQGTASGDTSTTTSTRAVCSPDLSCSGRSYGNKHENAPSTCASKFKTSTGNRRDSLLIDSTEDTSDSFDEYSYTFGDSDTKSYVSDDKNIFDRRNKEIPEYDVLTNHRDNDYKHIDDDFKVVVALPDYPKSKVQLYHMDKFNHCLNSIMDMQIKERLLVKPPAFIDCYINRGAIVCICRDAYSKLWIVRISTGIRERMKCDLLLLKTKIRKHCIAEMKIPRTFWPATAKDMFKLIQYFNPNLRTDLWEIYACDNNDNFERASFIIDPISYEILRGYNFKNVIDYSHIEFEIIGFNEIYYEDLSALEEDVSSVASRIKLLNALKSSDSVSTLCDPETNISVSGEYISNFESGSVSETSVIDKKQIKNNLNDTINENELIKLTSEKGEHWKMESKVDCVVNSTNVTDSSRYSEIGNKIEKDVFKNTISKQDEFKVIITGGALETCSTANIRRNHNSELNPGYNSLQNFPQHDINEVEGDHECFSNINCEKGIQVCDQEELTSKSSLNPLSSTININTNRGFAYNRRTNYLHIENNLKIAIVLEGYPKDKIEGTHIKLIKHIFKEHVQKETKTGQVSVIPKFSDVYLSNGAMIHICDNMNTKKYVIELLPKLIKSTGLKLTIRELNDLVRFTRVIMTLPEQFSSLESSEIFPKLQLSYPGLNPDCWKCYSDVVGKLKRQFGVDPKSLEIIKHPDFRPTYEGRVITFRIIDRRKDNTVEEVTANDGDEQIQNSLDISKSPEINDNINKVPNVIKEVELYEVETPSYSKIKEKEEECVEICRESPLQEEIKEKVENIKINLSTSIETETNKVKQPTEKMKENAEDKEKLEVEELFIVAKDYCIDINELVKEGKTNNIEILMRETLLKAMYCDIQPGIDAETVTTLRVKHYADLVPDDFKVYISPVNYPKDRIDEHLLFKIKKAAEKIVFENWDTEHSYIPQINDIYLLDGVIFVISKNKKSKFWIENNIDSIGAGLHLKLKTSEYRGAVGIVNMILRTRKSFEEVVKILQYQNPRLRTQYWRKIRTAKCSDNLDVFLQIDSLSAQVISSRNFNGSINGEQVRFKLGHLQTLIRSRRNLDDSCSAIDYDTIIDGDSNHNVYSCGDSIKESNRNEYNILNSNYLLNNNLALRNQDKINKMYYKPHEIDIVKRATIGNDYCRVNLIIPTSILPSSKGSLLIILDLLNKKNPRLNTDLWRIETICNSKGHFCVYMDKESAKTIKNRNFNSTVGGEQLIFNFE